MFKEDDLIQLSAMQHFVFCKRQCALIHIEQIWDENLFTAEGRVMHENVHEERGKKRRDVRIECGLSIRSLELGLSGKCDVVEFHKTADKGWVPFPVEYKRGKPKQDERDTVQLCAQALCLEEMLGVDVSRGAIFYGKTRHRCDVEFTEDLRGKTIWTAGETQKFVLAGITPKAGYEKKCDTCSLLDKCLPKTIEKVNPVKKYIERMRKQDGKRD
ncbi:MAG: CRISPR-associated protein Cas4 [Candidatus Omnitrophota bacterium]